MKILKSNEFWGRRSGCMYKGTKGFSTLAFKQMQWGTGTSGNTKKVQSDLKVNRKWFHGYKSKND